MNRRWICNDVWMDILPCFDRPQLGLKLALLSPRFNALYVNTIKFPSTAAATRRQTDRLPMLQTVSGVLLRSKMFYVPFLICKQPEPIVDEKSQQIGR
ncbi:hypothetical protein niasHS_008421 [Heterodera schachtii]|uniref:Uncharacterized protein n=1 Tax=Heterodera schachtii TaxID=97005 RepID=A0ABD2IUT5_HETSC